MLQIKNICKEYRTGSLVQKALDNVSLNFRDNEFVAILGPSGSGKTTLLNIVGGLDRYDSGDLIINGVSTKEYTDRDWDSYRNHTIGFVFQSYNLIAHQTVLANVELALTIGGISKEERRARATEALEKVGLGDQLHKKPTQMSGGQMQRVAIARALVNDPDILLADEPTGALDSETSIQVMELIKEIARDRLVIMVTHNPELAEQYANRIVNLKDGVIRSDTNPLIVESDEGVHRNLGKASMSFGTALALSFNNLKTKLARTLLVAFAGSIGIIGIALILSLSNGVDQYINGIEQDTLNEYPLLINSVSMDTAAMFAQTDGEEKDSEESEKEKAEVTEYKAMNSMFSMMENNDLKSLRAFLESGESKIKDYAKAIEYSYGVEPQIYRVDDDNDYTQINPDQTANKAGMGYGGGSVVMGTAYSTDVFHSLPENENLYKDQYEVKAGRWPEKYNECVVVVSRFGTVSDLCLYDLGLKDDKELNDKLDKLAKGEEIKVDKNEKPDTFDFEDFVGRKYKLVNAFETFTYNDSRGVWTSRAEDESYMRDLVKRSEDLEIVGVIQAKEGVKITMLQSDIYYPHELLDHLLDVSENSEIVKAQRANKKINVLTDKEFGEEGDSGFDMGSMFSFDASAMQNAFQFDASAFENLDGTGEPPIDPSEMLTPEMVKEILPKMTEEQVAGIVSMATAGYNADAMKSIFNAAVEGFLAQESDDPATDYTNLASSVATYMKSDAAIEIMKDDIKDIVKSALEGAVTQSALQDVVENVMSGFTDYAKGNMDPENPEKMVELSNIQAYLSSSEAQSKLSAEQQALVQSAIDNITISDEQAAKIGADLADGYAKYAAEAGDVPDPAKFEEAFSAYVKSADGQQVISEEASKYIDEKTIAQAIAQANNAYVDGVALAASYIVSGMLNEITSQIQDSMSGMTAGFSDAFKNAFKIDTSAFAKAFSVNFNPDDMTNLIKSLMTAGKTSYESNMQSFGWADKAEPIQISIFPYDFDSKNDIKAILDDYNERMEKEDEDKVIVYTDFVATLMGSVTDIIDAISYVLIAFVSISLIVSSIMIGVITYISVLERKKEIGILRAIGASKRNISQVFNAETFIIGSLAGLIGIGTSLLLLIPINAVIDHVTTANMVAALPPVGGVVLVILSVILTLIGGIIPSRKAAKSDPVTALRVE